MPYVTVSGYWVDQPHERLQGLRVELGAWDCVENAKDDNVFFYMDDEPLQVGDVIAGDFRVTEIEEQGQ